VTQLGIIFGAEIGHFVVLPVAPEIFDRIEFGSVGRQIFQVDSASSRAEKIGHDAAPMGPKPVPHDQQAARNVAQEMAEKEDDLRTSNRPGKQAKEEIPPGHSGNGGERLPAEMILENRGLAPGSPGSTPVRAFAQPALVDEDDRALFDAGFFLMAGQRYFFHRAMASSSRSIARPVGR
jgi:hypothetical protein